MIVEILSPSDTVEILDETIITYLEAGVPLLWIVDPKDRTVTIYRNGEEPVLVNVKQELTGGDVLPGFRLGVGRFFE